MRDLRALLRESQRCVQDWRAAHYDVWSCSTNGRAHIARLDKVIGEIDAALSEPAPEPMPGEHIHCTALFDEGARQLACAVCGTAWFDIPPPASQSDAKDAARYRWLRDCGDATWLSLAGRSHNGAKEIDTAIDAAIEREGT